VRTLDVPTIVVEFVSRADRDRHRDGVEKRRESRDLGVPEHWVFHRFRRQLAVFTGGANRPPEITVSEHETYRTDLPPGFELPGLATPGSGGSVG
jgi:Uma2 family endonuclease